MGLLDQYFDPATMEAVKAFGQPSEEEKRTARNYALMNAGFGMMMNNQGRSQSQALFNALGAGGQAGLQSYQGQLDESRQRNAQQFQMASQLQKLQQEAAQRKRQQEAIAQLPAEDQQAIAAGVPYKDMWTERNKPYTLGQGDQRFGANGAVIAQVAPKPELKEGYVVSDGNGGWKVDKQLFDANLQARRSGATSVTMPSITLNTEKTYAGNIAEGMAKNDLAVLEAAQSAGDRIKTARNVKALLDKNPITGTGAEWRLSANKALATAGLIDGKQVADTETLASNLASSTLDAIKTSGLGSGQGFTDKDRQFLERAKSGNIELNSETLRRLADLNERMGVATITRGQEVAKRFKMNPALGTVGQQLDFKVPDEVLPMPSVMKATNFKKGAIYETPKGQLRWNGMQFEDIQ